MRRARLIMVALIVSTGAVCAQTVDLGGKRLQVCLQAARAADDGCAKLTDDPAARIGCFQKARAEELACLEHAMSDAPATGAEQEAPAASASTPPPVQPAVTASPDVTIVDPPKAEAAVDPPEPPKAEAAANPSEPPKEEAAVKLPEPPKAEAVASPSEPSTGSVSANASQGTDQQAKDQLGKDQLGKDQPAAPPADPAPVRVTGVPPPAPAETAAIPSREPDATTLRDSGWVVSETTSPIDYSPLIAAVLRPASRLHDGPSSLTVRCRRGRTELSVWSEAGWRATRNEAVLIDHRVNKEPIVRMMWSLSADGQTATYKEDPIELLRSLPEGALLSISIADGDNPRREATFLLTGWTAIRQKIDKLCKWPPAERVTLGKR
jgi:hypothetical protein